MTNKEYALIQQRLDTVKDQVLSKGGGFSDSYDLRDEVVTLSDIVGELAAEMRRINNREAPLENS